MKLSTGILGLGAIVRCVATYDIYAIYKAAFNEPLDHFGKLVDAWQDTTSRADATRVFEQIKADYDFTNKNSTYGGIADIPSRLRIQQHVATELGKRMRDMATHAKLPSDSKKWLLQQIADALTGSHVAPRTTRQAEPQAKPHKEPHKEPQADLERQLTVAIKSAAKAEAELNRARNQVSYASARKQQAERELHEANVKRQQAEREAQQANEAKERVDKALRESRKRRPAPQRPSAKPTQLLSRVGGDAEPTEDQLKLLDNLDLDQIILSNAEIDGLFK